MNSWHAPWLDSFMWYTSKPEYWLPVYLIILYGSYKKYGKKGILWTLVGIGLVVLLADTIHRECFKEVFQRFRPSRNPELEGQIHLLINPKDGNFYKGGKYGFISGHAANFTGIALFSLLFLELKKWKKAGLIFWALLICYSRIYLGVHYPGDILGGILLGITIGVLCNFLVNKFLVKSKR